MFQIEFDNQNEHVIGIDLGTTNSLAAWMNLTKPEVIPGDDGDKLVPSVVSVEPDGNIIVGNAARVLGKARMRFPAASVQAQIRAGGGDPGNRLVSEE